MGMLFPEASAPFAGLRIRSQTPRCEAYVAFLRLHNQMANTTERGARLPPDSTEHLANTSSHSSPRNPTPAESVLQDDGHGDGHRRAARGRAAGR